MLIRYLLCAILFVHTLHAQTYTLKGKIVGHDGKPLVMAHILLSYNRDTIAWVAADKNGSFTIRYAENKTYDCKVTGVHHRPYFGKIYPAETPEQQVAIQLGTFPQRPDISTIFVVGDFNGFSTESGFIKKKNEGNKITFELEKTPARYVLAGLVARAVLSGTEGPYQPNPLPFAGDGYVSIAEQTNNDIHLDKMPPFDVQPLIRFGNALNDEMSKIQQRIKQREQTYLSKVMQASSQGSLASGQFTPIDLTDEYQALEQKINQAQEKMVRHTAMIEYLSLEAIKTKFNIRTNASNQSKDFSVFKGAPQRNYVWEAVSEIEPLSPLWTVTEEVIKAPVNAFPGSIDSLLPFYNKILEQSNDQNLRLAVLDALTVASIRNKDDYHAKNYYGMIKSEFPDSYEVKKMQSFYGITDSLETVKEMPSFTLPLIDNPGKNFTSNSMKGKYYLIDFWSVGCAGCIIKMPQLHEIYNKYKSEKFEIISVALNPTVQVTQDFRKKRFPMPWINLQPQDIFSSKIAKDFKVNYLPRTFLVDPDGKIVASDHELKSENLEKTLRRFLH